MLKTVYTKLPHQAGGMSFIWMYIRLDLIKLPCAYFPYRAGQLRSISDIGDIIEYQKYQDEHIKGLDIGVRKTIFSMY